MNVNENNFLKNFNFTFIDVGAKDGSSLLNKLKSNVNYIGFEPNKTELQKLVSKKSNLYLTENYLPFALDAYETEKDFYITQNPSFSSFLKLDEKVFEQHYGLMHAAHQWEKGFEIIETTKVKTQTLQHVFTQQNLTSIDFLKLDTQGTELAILKGGETLLTNYEIGVIFCEVSYVPIYKNQTVFAEIASYLENLNYVLVDNLHYPESRYYKGKKPNGHGYGKYYEKVNFGLVGDAIFAPNPTRVKLEKELAAKYGIILSNLGYLSIATQFFKQANLSNKQIENMFRLLTKKSLKQKFKNFAVNWLPPKLVYWLKQLI